MIFMLHYDWHDKLIAPELILLSRYTFLRILTIISVFLSLYGAQKISCNLAIRVLYQLFTNPLQYPLPTCESYCGQNGGSSLYTANTITISNDWPVPRNWQISYTDTSRCWHTIQVEKAIREFGVWYMMHSVPTRVRNSTGIMFWAHKQLCEWKRCIPLLKKLI